ncbi:hypothetical protein HAX54_043808, partial [Datura stramonium]|nr:hypothetical protein [Datura stramonium]
MAEIDHHHALYLQDLPSDKVKGIGRERDDLYILSDTINYWIQNDIRVAATISKKDK